MCDTPAKQTVLDRKSRGQRRKGKPMYARVLDFIGILMKREYMRSRNFLQEHPGAEL